MSTPQEKRELLFNVHRPVELPTKEFEDDWWPLISNAWTCNSGPKPTPVGAPLGYIRNYSCRLATKYNPKPKDTSNDTPDTKRRKRTSRVPCECQAAIKITHVTATGITTVERNHHDTPAVHTHSLADVDKVRRPAAIKALIGKESLKSNNPLETIASIRQLAEESGLGEVAAYVTRTELVNTRRKQRQTELKPLAGDDVLVDGEVRAAAELLASKGYQWLSFGGTAASIITGVMPLININSDNIGSSSNSSSNNNTNSGIADLAQGLVFARPQQLAKISTHGWLTLIGSVADTNKRGWSLFTLFVRDRLGCWDSGAHFFVSDTNSSTIAQALRLVRQLAPTWQPRYMLTDRSPAVTAGIETTFPRATHGEQQEEQQVCEVIYSTTHTMQVWKRSITDPQAQQMMIQALYCRTRLGFEYVIEKALSGCNDQATEQHIKDYITSTDRWALFARQESPFLLQAASLSVLDAYHREVKRLSSAMHGLIGTCRAIMEADDNSMELTLKTPTASCTNESTHIDDIPSSLLTRIKNFPYTIQTLLVDEALAVNTRIAKGKRSPGLKHPQCECDFFNKYLLPCRHILHTALFGDLSSEKESSFLDDADWMLFQGMLTKKEGLDVYRTRGSVSRNGHEFVEKTSDEGGKAEVDRLKMEELFERSKRLYQNLVDRSDQRGLDALVADLESLSSRQSI
ncbi:hypothetical protein F5H01DRAFT_345687 [Linnemannia elongata]|nr:hypothetical protein F5H01DRAFT_345687 [Linnemannia elongata]